MGPIAVFNCTIKFTTINLYKQNVIEIERLGLANNQMFHIELSKKEIISAER